MNEISGNLLDVKHGIICHQVNCQNVAGAGLALQIRRKWPEWYEVFHKMRLPLGEVSFWQASSSLYVANLYAQEFTGPGLQTDYQALSQCLHTVKARADVHRLPVYLPYKIGCGLAGGDWQVVSDLIEKIIPRANVVVYPKKTRPSER